MGVSEEKYSQQWFKERAFNALHRIGDGKWDYTDSLLLYSPQGQDAYESAQKTDKPYFELVTKPEHQYLKVVAKDIVSQLPEHLEYIDLGPGTENKEVYFFDELKKQGKAFTYSPVDVNAYFLTTATERAESRKIATRPMRASFEELPALLEESATPRLVSLLGLTFFNYEPCQIRDLLLKIAGENGYIMMDVQLKERVDILQLQNVYQEYVAPAIDGKIELLDLDPQTDVSPRFADSEIAIWTSLLKTNDVTEKAGLAQGDRIKLFQSLRPTKKQFEEELRALDYQLFDTGSSFVAALIKA